MFKIYHGTETCPYCGRRYHIQDYNYCPNCGK